MRNPARVVWFTSLSLVLGTCFALSARAEKESPEDNYQLMKLFVDTFEEIDQNYVKDVNRRELIEAAIQGMLAKLDPYSNYISPEDLTGFEQDVQQEFGGIGIQVHFDPDHRELIVMTPLPGTPAYEAGVRAGDRIVNINGQDVVEFELGKELSTAIKMLKGAPGEKVKLTVRHEAPVEQPVAQADPEASTNPAETPASEPAEDEDKKAEDNVEVRQSNIETIEITRAIIKVATVMGDRYNADGTWNFMIDDENKIGYIRLSHFSRNSAAEMQAALKQLEKEGMKGLILDLRWNPGGLLTAAVEISDMFIDSGKIVSTKGRNTQERVWRAKKRGTFNGFPVAVLINRFSASASEILSACLQDHERGIVVGERSWGKGSVQNVIELEDGTSALKLTTASYHRPSGKNIHRFPKAKQEDEWGVLPNEGYKVEFNTRQMLDYRKFRSERDVLRSEGPPKSDYVDAQFEKALDAVISEIAKGAGTQKAAEPDEQEEDEATETETKKAAEVPRSFFVVPKRDVL